jgi:phosphoribosylanthranilate isomerase
MSACPMFKIKICGITTVDDALHAVEAGADAVGIHLTETSPRRIDAGRACEIVDAIRDRHDAAKVAVYAVFADALLDDILWALRDAELYGDDRGVGIQLHGDESPLLLAELQQHGIGRPQGVLQAMGYAPIVPVVRAFRETTDEAAIDAWLAECNRLGAPPDAILLERKMPGHFRGLPVILGGDLTPENVGEAIAAAQPDAIDVVAGVETSPGVKDAAKVWRFVAEAQKAFPGLATRQTPPA